MLTREEKINALVEDWLDSIASEGGSTVEHMLRSGFKGYDNMTDEEVDRDYAANLGDNDDEED